MALNPKKKLITKREATWAAAAASVADILATILAPNYSGVFSQIVSLISNP